MSAPLPPWPAPALPVSTTSNHRSGDYYAQQAFNALALDAAFARLAPEFAVKPLAGADLYPRIRAAHTIIATTEPALFANVILRKGVIGADGRAV